MMVALVGSAYNARSSEFNATTLDVDAQQPSNKHGCVIRDPTPDS